MKKTKDLFGDSIFGNNFIEISAKDMGDTVICDICDRDYTDSEECGGFLFGSYAYCPVCAKDKLPRIKSFGEEGHISRYCPPAMSFKDFVIKRCR